MSITTLPFISNSTPKLKIRTTATMSPHSRWHRVCHTERHDSSQIDTPHPHWRPHDGACRARSARQEEQPTTGATWLAGERREDVRIRAVESDAVLPDADERARRRRATE